MPVKKVIVIGGGAAGFFAAINLAENKPALDIKILEKTGKLLSKVRISGGGRCNVTHHCFDSEVLLKNYPRGHRELQQVFARFSVAETIRWFEEKEVLLKTEDDGRMFPVSDDSATIIECFTTLAERHRISVITHCDVHSIEKNGERFRLKTGCGDFTADAVIFATGGHPKKASYNLLLNLGHNIVDPVPSLFTFNMPGERIKKELQGVSVKDATVSLAGTRLKQSGPLLITHWGMSGPAVLRMSAFAALELFDRGYHTDISVNWIGLNAEEALQSLRALQQARRLASPFNTPQFGLPARLWEFLCSMAGIGSDAKWADVPKRQIAALATVLCNSIYRVEGKTTFKEEFVTCGGVDLRQVDFRSMESRIVPGLYFCGEVLNIDGVTGGFNFQAAWSTAWLCARSVSERLK